MTMIDDIYTKDGIHADRDALARDLGAGVMQWEPVPDSALFRNHTAPASDDFAAGEISDVAGQSNDTRGQVVTSVGALDRDKQIGVAEELTDDIIASPSRDLRLAGSAWVLLTESPEGGWGVAGRANTVADLDDAPRADIAQRAQSGTDK
jgi:hypothetical protein